MDWDRERREFRWDTARERELHPLGEGRINVFHEAVGHHVEAGRGEQIALRWIAKDGDVHDFTYGELDALAGRFAGVLAGLGVQRGDRVFTLLGRVPELYVTALGTLRAGAVFCPLFSAFGPEPIASRVGPGDGRVLVTTTRFYERKVKPIREKLPSLEHVLLIDGAGEGCTALAPLMEAAEPVATVPMEPEEMALLHFTSGTTGKPKGAVHVHAAVLAHRMTGRWVLDLGPGDVFWCTADPGWVTGTSYGILAPLTLGATMIVDEAEFDAPRWYRILQDQRVAVWYTAPTAIRMLMKMGLEVAKGFDLSSVRHALSVGEPLASDGVRFGQDLLGIPFHDTWWQTETGAIMIANLPGQPVRPGSMGKPVPGIEAAVVERDGDRIQVLDDPEAEGELALRPGWPSMFRTYLHNEERYQKSFADGWYLSGDLAKRDADGYFWFVGRADDVFKSAGHLIGPFEVEAALVEHPDINEAAVIGKPDPVAGSIVKAFLVPRPGVLVDEALDRSVRAHARLKLGPAVAPREVEFVDHLPHTRSGKVMRRLLKARELGLPEGDTSTLETPMTQPLPGRGHALHLLTQMLRIRRFEERCAELYSAGRIRGFLHLYIGEEAVATGALRALTLDDAMLCTYREHGHALVRGVPMNAVMAEMFGKQEGCSRGRGGSMHLFDAGRRLFGGNAIVAGHLPVAVGMGLGDRLAGRNRVTACFFGEGAMAEGEFHESMNLAALWRLPVLFACENNGYAMGTALERSESQTALCAKAASYGVPAVSIDGMDVLEVERETKRVVDGIRASGTPAFIEFRTYRFRAHSMFDAELYRDKAEVDAWKKRDPIQTFYARMVEAGILTEADLAHADEKVLAEVGEAVAYAEAGTWEPVEELTRDVYTESR